MRRATPVVTVTAVWVFLEYRVIFESALESDFDVAPAGSDAVESDPQLGRRAEEARADRELGG